MDVMVLTGFPGRQLESIALVGPPRVFQQDRFREFFPGWQRHFTRSPLPDPPSGTVAGPRQPEGIVPAQFGVLSICGGPDALTLLIIDGFSAGSEEFAKNFPQCFYSVTKESGSTRISAFGTWTRNSGPGFFLKWNAHRAVGCPVGALSNGTSFSHAGRRQPLHGSSSHVAGVPGRRLLDQMGGVFPRGMAEGPEAGFLQHRTVFRMDAFVDDLDRTLLRGGPRRSASPCSVTTTSTSCSQ